MDSKSFRRLLGDGIGMTLGTALYAVALDVFLIPNRISPGGVAGFAAIANTLLGTPTGLVTVLLNLPLFVWGGIGLGWRFLRKTAYATLAMSVFLDLFELWLPTYTGDRLLACLYGGLIGGVGLAFVFLRGGSTGGFDIVAKLLSVRFPLLSLGRIILLLDVAVVAAATLAYRDAETALYTVVALFLTTRALDGLLAGAERGRLAIVITRKAPLVIDRIFDIVGRGATLLEGQGGYNGNDTGVVLCALRSGEVSRLHRAVREADEHAFLILAEVGEIAGEGFGTP